MIQIGECFYMGPRVGDVALLTTKWRDSDAPETIHHTVVPVVGGVAWWSWCREAPLFVRQTLQKMYDTVENAKARGDLGEDEGESYGATDN